MRYLSFNPKLFTHKSYSKTKAVNHKPIPLYPVYYSHHILFKIILE